MNSLKISKWDECKIELKPSDNRIKMMVKKTSFVKGFNEGEGLDAIIKITKPRPYIDFNYDSKLVVAYHQPELSFFEKTQCTRPDYAINSIAFYHAIKKNNEYKVGKIGHLYRVKLFDAVGNWVWTNWTKERDGIIRLWLDKTFLKLGLAPFRIVPAGDIFGYQTTGLSQTSIFNAGDIACENGTYSPTSNGTGVSMQLYGYSPNAFGNLEMGLYTYTSPANGSKLTNGVTAAMTPGQVDSQWQVANFSISPSVLSGSSYFLCFQGDLGLLYVNYDSGPNLYYGVTGTFGTWPATLTFTNESIQAIFSIYCTYTSTGGGGPISAIPLGFIHGR